MANLNENIKGVVSAFEDIKTELSEQGGNINECTSILDYGKAIKELPVGIVQTNYVGTFMAFTQSESVPDTPEGGSWNGETLIYPPGWNNGIQKRRSVQKQDTYMSYSVISANSETVTWSPPIKISGNDGINSEMGTILIDGIAYWTLNGELLYDSNGNKIKAQGIDGKDSSPAFKSFIFTRNNNRPLVPEGGSYNYPFPEGQEWHDGIPEGTDPVWASSRIFSIDGTYPQQEFWSNPELMADDIDLDVEFSSIEFPTPPEGHPNTNPQWSNISNENSIWMATSKKKNLEWSDWQVVKIKGENGTDGKDGKDGKDGDTGASTPVIYPAGEFDITKEYIGNNKQAPYVLYQGEYYIAYGYPEKGKYPVENVISEPDWGLIIDNGWIKMEKFHAIYSDIGMFDEALLGKWVFHGNYMFSQYGHIGTPKEGNYIMHHSSGTKTNGNECTYNDVLTYNILFEEVPGYRDGEQLGWKLYDHISNGSWVPNICLNAKTGEGRFGDGLNIDQNGITAILKNPVFKKEDLYITKENPVIELSKLSSNTNYVINSQIEDSSLEFRQYLYITSKTYGEDNRPLPITVLNDLNIQITNNTNYMINIIFEGSWGWHLIRNFAELDDISVEELVESIDAHVWKIASPGITNNCPNYYTETDTLLIYPKTSIKLDIKSNYENGFFKHISDIIPEYPMYTTLWNSKIVACNINSFIPYEKMSNTGVCKAFIPNQPLTTISKCNFDYIKFVDNLKGETALVKIYNEDLQFLSNVFIEDTNDWVSIPVPKGGTISIYYSNMKESESCIDCHILFATTHSFGGAGSLNLFTTDLEPQTNFLIVGTSCTGRNDNYFVDLQYPDGTTEITISAHQYNNEKLFRYVDVEGVIPYEESEYDSNELQNINVRFKRDDGSYKTTSSSRETENSIKLITSNSMSGSLGDSFQLRLNPYFVMTGINRNRSIKLTLSAKIINSTTPVTADLIFRLNGQRWSNDYSQIIWLE